MPGLIQMRRPGLVRVHDAALFYAAAEISRRNHKITQVFADSGEDISVERGDGNPTLVRVKGKTSHDWQAPFDMARLEGPGVHLVVFVDLDPRTAPTPAFWIAPEKWVLADITRHHKAYLDRHGGKRPRSPKAKHHSISAERLLKWRDRWDLFE